MGDFAPPLRPLPGTATAVRAASPILRSRSYEEDQTRFTKTTNGSGRQHLSHFRVCITITKLLRRKHAPNLLIPDMGQDASRRDVRFAVKRCPHPGSRTTAWCRKLVFSLLSFGTPVAVFGRAGTSNWRPEGESGASTCRHKRKT